MAFDIDGNVIYACVSGGPHAVAEALSVGLKPSSLDGRAAKAFGFIVQHMMEHATVPSAGDITSLFGDVVVQTDIARAFVFQECANRTLFRRIAAGQTEVDERLKANDPQGAFAALTKAREAAANSVPKKSAPTSLFSLGGAVLASYEESLLGGIPIPAPWESVNAMTRGWMPGTNSWFAARPGSGKTFLAIEAGLYAWDQRNLAEKPKTINVLFVTPEMLELQIAERAFVMRSKIPYGAVVGASLSHFQMEKYKATIQALQEETGFWVMDASRGISPDRIGQAIEDTNADLVIIDAAYKIKWLERAKDRFENMFVGVETVSNWSKREWRGDRKIAIVASSQMNRGGDKKSQENQKKGPSQDGPGQSALALSDNIAWEADNLFMVDQDEDDKQSGISHLFPSKVRRMGEWRSKITLRWDMQKMDFSEIPQPKKGAAFKDTAFAEGEDSPF
ncbi:DnaB, replicative DNA helicase [uncultured Caudovirales phage]|uniref:DnaB, replicative DNA helicase n=1 Tax=uncultured Caudovirales phage TaxID=2100421 RepID=A0A6J5S5F3_9CAUD|nr:DnaB, replicative DNA helicase [uncultured Caudovirales phage]